MLKLTSLRGIPAFVTSTNSAKWSRVFGARLNKRENVWYMPAFPPFLNIVIGDVRKVSPEALQQAEIVNHIESTTEMGIPESFKFNTAPYDHQVEGLQWAYKNWRAALFYEMGTGKTKIMVDLLRLLKHTNQQYKTLVLAPLVAIQNWAAEFETHASNEFKVGTILGTQKQKLAVIANADTYDVLIATYGTARTLGVPKVHKKVADYLLEHGVTLNARIKLQLASCASQKAQLALAEELLAGTVAVTNVSTQPVWLSQVPYSVLICDESHRIKDIRSKQTKAVLKLTTLANRRYLLTGTPATGDPRHLYPQLRALAPYISPENWWQFNAKFVRFSKHNKHIVLGYKNLNILNRRVALVGLEKKKADCLDLPDRTIVDVTFELTPEQRKVYNDFVKKNFALVEQDDTSTLVASAIPATTVGKLLQITSGFLYKPTTDGGREAVLFKKNPKLDALSGLLEDILANASNKVIIWAHYTAELDQVEELLKASKAGYVRVDGSNSCDVHVLKDKFQQDATCRVYLAQTNTGISITLNAANYAVFYGLNWALEPYQQALDRNHRAGQTRKVTVYRLVSKQAIDNYVTMSYDTKQDINAILTAKHNCLSCRNSMYCLSEDIEPFDRGCIYKSAVAKTTARAREVT